MIKLSPTEQWDQCEALHIARQLILSPVLSYRKAESLAGEEQKEETEEPTIPTTEPGRD